MQNFRIISCRSGVNGIWVSADIGTSSKKTTLPISVKNYHCHPKRRQCLHFGLFTNTCNSIDTQCFARIANHKNTIVRMMMSNLPRSTNINCEKMHQLPHLTLPPLQNNHPIFNHSVRRFVRRLRCFHIRLRCFHTSHFNLISGIGLQRPFSINSLQNHGRRQPQCGSTPQPESRLSELRTHFTRC